MIVRTHPVMGVRGGRGEQVGDREEGVVVHSRVRGGGVGDGVQGDVLTVTAWRACCPARRPRVIHPAASRSSMRRRPVLSDSGSPACSPLWWKSSPASSPAVTWRPLAVARAR
ncbi:hypothetical protein ACN24K_01560 [Streptomyces microflavus]